MNEPQNPKQFREGFVEEAPPSPQTTTVPKPEPEPEARPQPELEIEKWPIVVKLLHKKIKNNNAELVVDQLSFREPRGGDINRYGNPVRIDQNGDVVIDERKMTTIMAVLSGILQPFLEDMDPRDWNSCAYRLRSFFLPDPAAW